MPIILNDDFEEKPLENLSAPTPPVEPEVKEEEDEDLSEFQNEPSEPLSIGPIADREFLEAKYDRGELQGVAKAIEENLYIPIVDMLDGSRDADQVAQDRAKDRRDRTVSAAEIEKAFANDKSFAGESVRAVAGSVEDFAEGIANLPGDVASLLPGVDDDFMNVDFNFIRENIFL